jgi:hypothetical protein
MKVLSTLRSRGRLIVLALLPAMLLRVLTPVGFMPMHDARGGLYLAFCPGVGDTSLSQSAVDPHRHHHAMPDHDGDPAPAPRHHDLCPYALSAGPVLAHSVPDVAASMPRAVAVLPADYPVLSLPTIERAQSARAPPAPRIA